MTLFVDTSGIVALVDRDDPAHAAVVEAFEGGRFERLVTHVYVIVDTLAVARRRFGPDVTAVLMDRVIPALDVVPVDAELHAASMAAFRVPWTHPCPWSIAPASRSWVAKGSSWPSRSTSISAPRGSRHSPDAARALTSLVGT